MDWSKKTVLVTGAGGFIGSHLTEQMVRLGAKTRALVHYNAAGRWGWLDSSPQKGDIEVVLGDIQDPDCVRQATSGVDVIFHLAALIAIPYSYRAPLSYIRTNIEGTLNVLQAARQHGISLVVQTSTSEVYGSALAVPISEDHPLQGQSPYAASKIGSDKLAEAFHLSYGLPVATIRPFNTFGPRQSARAIIPTIITQALTRSTVRLGHTQPTRDFNYVADTVAGFVRVAESPQSVGRVINIGSGREISVGDLAAMIVKLVGREVSIEVEDQRKRPAQSEVARLCAGNERAQALLGWMPQHSLQDGLLHTIEWIRQNLNHYKLELYTV